VEGNFGSHGDFVCVCVFVAQETMIISLSFELICERKFKTRSFAIQADRTESEAQVAEHLSSKYDILNSKPSTTKERWHFSDLWHISGSL
jgi:hypothetical protein